MRVLDWQWKFITQFEKKTHTVFSLDLWQHGKILKDFFNTLVSKIKRYIEYSSFDKGGRRVRLGHGWGIICFNRIAFERIEIWKLTSQLEKQRWGKMLKYQTGRHPWSCFGRWASRKIIAVGGGYQTGQILLYRVAQVPLNDICCSYSVLPPTFLLSFLY